MKILRKRTAVFQLLFLIFLLTVFFVNIAIATQSKDVEKQSSHASEQIDDTSAHKDPHDTSTAHDQADAHHGHANLGEFLPLWSCIPFAGILLSIALFPLSNPGNTISDCI
jgi:hypothetical protein